MKTYLKYIKIDSVQNIELSYLNLPSNIREHIRTKKNELHFKQSVIAWSLVYKLADELFNISNFVVQFSENGKPIVPDNSFYFSISHSKDYVVVVLSTDEVGVDVEELKKTRDLDYLCRLEVSAKLKDKSIFSCKEDDLEGINFYDLDLIKKYKLIVGSYKKLDIEVL